MGILYREKPKKAMSKEAWESISADSAPPGVYTPNMSQEDMERWKAKIIVNGDDPRVEIRKTLHYVQVVVVVRAEDVKISANGSMFWKHSELAELQIAVTEALQALKDKGKA